MQQPTFKTTALGCKVNQYDASAIEAALEDAGLQRAPYSATSADIIVVATCCVTTTAMRKSRQAIRKAVRNSPDAAILIFGCYCDYDAKRVGELLSSLNVPTHRIAVAGHHGVSLPEQIQQLLRSSGLHESRNEQAGRHRNDLSINSKSNACPAVILPDYTTIRPRRNAAVKRNLHATRNLPSIKEFAGHQRAFIKVQDGCDAFCTYCVVPYARSILHSRPTEQIVAECSRLVQAGYKEIVLSGVFLGAYGRNTAIRKQWKNPQAPPLADLVRQVAAIDGLWRLRLSSLEPADMTDEMMTLWSELPSLAPHLHLPLQSGSARILKRMNRQYTPEQFRNTAARLRDAMDRPAITTDIIVGFPGETDDDFAQTLAVATDAGFPKIHAFPFSAIEGTAAWSWRKDCPPKAVIKQRMAAMASLEHEMADNYRKTFVGQTLEALIESTRLDGGYRRAMTDRYLTVRFRPPAGPGTNNLTGEIVTLQIDGVCEEGLVGTMMK